ncbi:lysophospholipase [Paenibacillus barcinonensis]|uniref:Lysophospholipase n=1 Tax=Paenibacillus barcinonensis TaxID=198119 RepID=A0A2V4VF34_PAEBA|nr:alpha/beta hydrolase [Paenibacillus barcinonensis]PYE52440.1 lysophospholipase [Paenibacillus barcinonensis]QKS59451.1 lysophospholipase [Paenibacillus barcinonensis]
MTKSETTIQSFDGTQLYFSKDIVENAKAAVVIVHGLAEHASRYDYVTEKLNNRGFNVYRFDHRGHARSEGPRTFYSDFHHLIDDVNVIVEAALQESGDTPLFVIGHSMGGFATSSFATKYPGKVKGIVLSGALTRYNTKVAGELPMDLPAGTYFPNELGSGVCGDPEVVSAYANDPLVEKQISVDLFNSLGYGMEWLKQHAEQFVEPVLLLHGANDGLVSEKDSRDFFGDIASTDKTLKIYANLMHEIFNEKAKDEVIEEAIAWIEKRI